MICKECVKSFVELHKYIVDEILKVKTKEDATVAILGSIHPQEVTGRCKHGAPYRIQTPV